MRKQILPYKVKMKIAFLGDSITLGYGLEDKSVRYSTLVSDKLGLEEENYGITGTLVAKAAYNKKGKKGEDLDFVSRLELIREADVAVVFGGTNDYFWSDESMRGDVYDVKYFCDAIDTICRFLVNERKGKANLLVTPYAHNGIGNYLGGENASFSNRHDTDQKNYNGYVLRDYVKVIAETAEHYGVPCLDLHKDIGFDWRIHTMDGCHPNEDGHAVLAKIISKALIPLLK